MKTGNLAFKYYTYSIIWANKIIANIKGYSIEKAYEIDPIFGRMIEEQLADYQKQLDRLRYIATIFEVFDQCKSMFDNFYETFKNDIDYLLNTDKNVEAEAEHDLGFADYSADELPEGMKQAMVFNELWDRKMAYVMQQIGEISLEKTHWLPSYAANIFKEQHKIVTDLVENIGVYNKMRYDCYCDKIENTVNSRMYANLGNYDASEFFDEEISSSTTNFNKNLNKYVEVQQENIATYHNNMQLLDKIREEILDD